MEKDIIEQIKYIVNVYNDRLSFPEYARIILKDENIPSSNDVDFKICCPLHDENTPSFSYSASRDLWYCFGQCRTGGHTVEFHRKYMEKISGVKQSVFATLKDLYRLFPNRLPKPILNNKQDSSDIDDLISGLESVMGTEIRDIKIRRVYDNRSKSEILLHSWLKNIE